MHPTERIDSAEPPMQRYLIAFPPRKMRGENLDRDLFARLAALDRRGIDRQDVALIYYRWIVTEILRGSVVIEEPVALPLDVVELGVDISRELGLAPQLVRE